jgi:rubredoxin
MTESFFAGAYGGDPGKVPPGARLECKICWHVYNPVEGDEYWQIPKGTPFSELPGHWTCPNCDAPKESFLIVED